nr:uncharacterized protein LOC132780623 isoform X1 [Anolis sagrei ordinatus]
MKLLVVLFVLTAVTGGQAMTIREAPSSEPKLRELMDKIYVFGYGGFIAVAVTLEKIAFSAPSTIISSLLAKTYETLREQEAELPPEFREAKEFLEAFLEKTFRVYDQLKRYNSDELDRVMEALALYVDPVASKAFKGVEWLEENVKPTVVEVYQAYERGLDQAMESLKIQVFSYSKELQAKEMQEFGESLQASMVEAAKKLLLGLETLSKHSKPYWSPFLKEYKKYEPGLREWVERPLIPAQKKD